ncbi:HesA/MoeB/ThiF family protein [Frigidibacter sp. ROC022]|uniref:HesA/MoeB/ThiF family protein n=1 Tax=Frigidibacter sp. ROC022 TaxID=2971796 RepID=UPI00215B13F6|nr:molybdopterin-synthase adenylyltransferase MoeB [Frigidibacter sp. ROC022]MCR8724011.1 molybdopterin-synthase adenylyltransferase MoeB [Frigidibacter sp. ROC022]
MIFALLLAALVLWVGGGWLGWPRGLRLGLLALGWAAIFGLLLLPSGDGLARALGGGAAAWGAVGVAGLLVALYAQGLAWLKAKARARQAAPSPSAAFSDAELERYSRHILLQELGGPGQKKLKSARVLVIGAGGLGAPALQYLAAAGVGTIGVIDDDKVDVSNLHRQVIHPDAATGQPKVQSAAAAMQAQNPHIRVRPYQRRLTGEIAADLFADYDLILDGSDNFDTRYLANRVAVAQGKPLISGAMTQWEGQISIWDPARGGPCYECVFAEAPAPGMVPACAVAGVVGPLPGVIGTMMALEAVKLIVGAGEPMRGRMLIWDGLYAEARVVRMSRREDCPVCGEGAQAVGQ